MRTRTLSRFRRAQLVLIGLLASACVSEAAVGRDSQPVATNPPLPTWSLPDDSSELLIAQGEDFGSGAVVLARTNGTIVETIPPQGYGGVFSPDGTEVAFVAVDETAATGQETAVTIWARDGTTRTSRSSGGIVTDLQWAPSGDRVLFSSITVVGDSSATSHIRVMDTETMRHEEVPVNDDGSGFSIIHQPSWTPDGESAVAVDGRDRTAVAVNVSEGTSETLDLPFAVLEVRHSPTSDRIALIVDGTEDAAASGLYQAEPDGSNLVHVGGDTAEISAIVWSPSGGHVVTVGSQWWTLWAGNADGGSSGVPVDSTSLRQSQPVWSPSSAWWNSSDEAVFAATIADTGEVALVDIQGDLTPIGVFGTVTDWRAG